MTLPTHAAGGLIVASFLPPGIAQVAAFVSHFVLDLVPHWEKDKTEWLKNNKELLIISSIGELLIAFGLCFYVMNDICGHIQYMSAAVLSCLPDINHLIGKKSSILPIIRWLEELHEACHFWQRQNGNSQGNNGPPIFQCLFCVLAAIVVINVNS